MSILNFRILLREFVHFIAPNYCLLCQKFGYQGDDSWLCPDCNMTLPRITAPICFDCGLPLQPEESCPDCKTQKFAFDRHRSVGIFDQNFKQLIHAYKYHHKTPLTSTWLGLIAENVQLRVLIESADVICAVPMSTRRLCWRGYNHADLLAKAIAKHWQKPLLENILIKSPSTRQNAKLNRQQRQENLLGAIQLKKMDHLNFDNVLLVDDVFTTGATLNACAQLLRQNKVAKRVYCLTIARSLQSSFAN
jgi:ComF family protein